MNIDSQIVALLKKENPDMYQYFINRINEEMQPKVYVTKFKKISRYTTVKKLQELEDLGFEELHRLFLEKCEYYGANTFVKEWLYIPEMMHVLASLFYDKPDLHPLNVQQMREHWDATKAKKRPITSKKVVIDMFVDDE